MIGVAMALPIVYFNELYVMHPNKCGKLLMVTHSLNLEVLDQNKSFKKHSIPFNRCQGMT